MLPMPLPLLAAKNKVFKFTPHCLKNINYLIIQKLAQNCTSARELVSLIAHKLFQ